MRIGGATCDHEREKALGPSRIGRVELELEGRVAVVTGASRGIGRAIVDELLAEGVAVVAGARDITSLEGLDGVSAISVDLSTPSAPSELIDFAVARHGGLDFLVNNVAGVRLHFAGFESILDEDWQWAFDLNFLSAVRAIRAALPHLRERKGAIVNVSSLNGRLPSVQAPEYSATKAALNSVSRVLALELASAGVRVNVVSPGPVLTDVQIGPGGIAEHVAAQSGGSVEDYVAAVEQGVPLGRFAEPGEVAAVVVSLLSRRFGYVTGADVAVDGATQSG
jgi:NAD(P)-dependent dehydrogenase (short-subunit alcohol dehydrogenase family)